RAHRLRGSDPRRRPRHGDRIPRLLRPAAPLASGLRGGGLRAGERRSLLPAHLQARSALRPVARAPPPPHGRRAPAPRGGGAMRILAAALLLAACSGEQNLVPPDWDLNRMVRQPRY